MQDMLVPIFGENGAIIVQYAITLAVVVALIALVIWGIRHYGGGAVRPAVRGRLPRLAIVDTLPVDNKRRLVLLRRDNVEHLVLIGGPSDIVVEPSIVRQRVAQRPGQSTANRPATASAPVALAAAPPLAPPAEETAEFAIAEPAPVRVPLAEAEASASTASTRRGNPGREQAVPERAARSYMPSRRETVRPAQASAMAETPRAQRAHAAASDAREPTDPHEIPSRPAPGARHDRASSRFAPAAAPPEPDEPNHGPVPGYESIADEPGHDAVSAFAPRAYDEEQGADPGATDSVDQNHGIEVGGAPPTADAEPPEGTGEPDEVNELELEMARLLGQISTPRQERD